MLSSMVNIMSRQQNSPIEAGELVRCRNMERWWVGKVIKTTEGSLLVSEIGSNRRWKVLSSQAVPFAQFLKRLRRARKLKTVYAEFSDGVVLEHMPQRRLRSLFQRLRTYGIDFDDAKTRANDYFPMWTNRAHLLARKRANPTSASLPAEVTHWLPKWLVAEDLPPSSRDPLGLQADAGKLADSLLPGLNVFTNRVGYFFFLPWLLEQLNCSHGIAVGQRRDLLNRVERALVLCETLHHGEEAISNCFHQGQRMKTALLAQATMTATIPDRILKNQNNTGCYNLYRNALLSCGFWCEDEDEASRGFLPYRLTARGERMAQAFARCEGAQAILRWASAATGRPRPVGDLKHWGSSFCFCDLARSQKEKFQFLGGFLFAKNDAPNVVRDGARRRETVKALAKARLLNWKSTKYEESSKTLVTDDAMVTDVTEAAEVPDGGENISVLLHFYSNRSAPGARPFVAAAVYELLGLAMNGVWKGLLDDVTGRGLLAVSDWVSSATRRSQIPRFWSSRLQAAAATVRAPERVLVGRLLAAEDPVQNGMMLAAKVLLRNENQNILNEDLAQTELRELLKATLEMNPHETVRGMLSPLVLQLLKRHRHVSERKGKQQWLQDDGQNVWKAEARETRMALGFHSYRLPQLMSLIRDLELKRSDLLC
jgi:hypothetical protein